MKRTLQEYGKRNHKVKRRTTEFSKKLPKGWRMQICKKLSEQGISINPQTVTDILSGKNTKIELLEKVVAIRQEISKAYLKNQKKREALIDG